MSRLVFYSANLRSMSFGTTRQPFAGFVAQA
jgi:hypothetical protein